ERQTDRQTARAMVKFYVQPRQQMAEVNFLIYFQVELYNGSV
ncbi:uncharacterized protein Dwil_GK27135, partial [Drosophila willistoni]